MITKYEIVERFKEVGDDLYRGVVKGSGYRVDGKDIELNGVIFIREWAYYTNNHFILRCRCDDRVCDESVITFDWEKEDEIEHLDSIKLEPKKSSKNVLLFYDFLTGTVKPIDEVGMPSHAMNNVGDIFNKYRGNKVIFNKNLMLANLETVFGKKITNRGKSIVCFNPNSEYMSCITTPIKENREKDIFFRVPTIEDNFMWSTKPNNDYKVCAVNARYLGLIEVFKEAEYIVMTYNNLSTNTKDTNHRERGTVKFEAFDGDGPPITLIIAQAILPFNPFENF